MIMEEELAVCSEGMFASRRFAFKHSFTTSSDLDLNECTTLGDDGQSVRHTCDHNALCSNVHGSFHCTCVQGYTGDGSTCTSEKCIQHRYVVSANCQLLEVDGTPMQAYVHTSSHMPKPGLTRKWKLWELYPL